MCEEAVYGAGPVGCDGETVLRHVRTEFPRMQPWNVRDRLQALTRAGSVATDKTNRHAYRYVGTGKRFMTVATPDSMLVRDVPQVELPLPPPAQQPIAAVAGVRVSLNKSTGAVTVHVRGMAITIDIEGDDPPAPTRV